MSIVPSSPRLRRRLTWLGAVFTAAGVITAILLLVPDPKPENTAPATNALPAQLATHSTHVSRTERRAIDRTLDRFLGAALDRSAPATAWHLAGPELKTGSTLRQWRAGTSPIPYFPAREQNFHDWTAVDTGPRYVVFDHLVVHPRKGAQTSSWIFSGEVVKHGSQWLVNRLYTIAVMKKPTKAGTHQLGPQDYAAQAPSSSGGSQTSTPTLGKQWLLIGGGLVGLALLFPLGFGIVSVVRSRRRRKRYLQTRSEELPPLPRPLQTSSADSRRH
jgi:hypothetical protein